MLIQGKPWGTTQRLFIGNNVEVHRIAVKKGGYCSRHKHRNKFNLFYVESGKLLITTFHNDVQDAAVLPSGASTTIAPGEMHQFEALEETVALEIYHVELDQEDIERFTSGGIKLASNEADS